ncbi:hypothetical protein KGY73_03500 [bacterium]|nr:hypothetical protein [bacterium]
MRYKKVGMVLLFLLSAFILSSIHKGYSSGSLWSKLKEGAPQTVKKGKYDYMSTFLSRNTKPLGLKENKDLKKFLNQSNIKWAIRSEEKHILY